MDVFISSRGAKVLFVTVQRVPNRIAFFARGKKIRLNKYVLCNTATNEYIYYLRHAV